jgi:hypothetical protein
MPHNVLVDKSVIKYTRTLVNAELITDYKYTRGFMHFAIQVLREYTD